MTVKLYDAAQVTMVFMGILIDSGLAEGEFLSIDQEAADYEMKVGADGQVGRSRTNNLSAAIKLKLMQTSDGNTALGALRIAGLLAKNGADVGPMLVRDRLSGVRMYTAQSCWIAKPPSVVFANQIQMNEWELNCDALIRVDAGS